MNTYDDHINNKNTNIINHNGNLQQDPASVTKSVAHNMAVGSRFSSPAELDQHGYGALCQERHEHDHGYPEAET